MPNVHVFMGLFSSLFFIRPRTKQEKPSGETSQDCNYTVFQQNVEGVMRMDRRGKKENVDTGIESTARVNCRV